MLNCNSFIYFDVQFLYYGTCFFRESRASSAKLAYGNHRRRCVPLSDLRRLPCKQSLVWNSKVNICVNFNTTPKTVAILTLKWQSSTKNEKVSTFTHALVVPNLYDFLLHNKIILKNLKSMGSKKNNNSIFPKYLLFFVVSLKKVSHECEKAYRPTRITRTLSLLMN